MNVYFVCASFFFLFRFSHPAPPPPPRPSFIFIFSSFCFLFCGGSAQELKSVALPVAITVTASHVHDTRTPLTNCDFFHKFDAWLRHEVRCRIQLAFFNGISFSNEPSKNYNWSTRSASFLKSSPNYHHPSSFRHHPPSSSTS